MQQENRSYQIPRKFYAKNCVQVLRQAAVFGLRPDFYGGAARWRGRREIPRPGAGGAGGEPLLSGPAGYRVQGYQAMLGVPVPDATQWDQIEQVGDCAYKVFA